MRKFIVGLGKFLVSLVASLVLVCTMVSGYYCSELVEAIPVIVIAVIVEIPLLYIFVSWAEGLIEKWGTNP